MLGHHNLHTDGAQIDGVVLHWEPAPYVRTQARIVVGVKFEDGEKAEFTEDITDYCQPQATSLMQRLGQAGGSDVIPLELYEGTVVPVRYDPSNRHKLAIDVPVLHERAIESWNARQEKTGAQAERVLDEHAHPRHDPVEPLELAPDLLRLMDEPAPAAADADGLVKLAELHRRGELTDEEFSAAKRKLLGI
jgi:hypothetical protein